MRPNLTSSTHGVSRVDHYWCNICQQACGSDEALREHYRQCHPDVAAKIEQLAASLRQADAGLTPYPQRRVT